MLKSLLFNLFLALWTLIFGLICSPFLLCSKNSTILNNIAIFWAKILRIVLAKLCHLHLQVEGLANIPEAPFIIAAKHQSALDIIALIELLGVPKFIMKRSLIFVPMLGLYSYKLGMVLIDRSGGPKTLRSMVKKSKQTFLEGNNILIFPEGTRTKYGEKVKYKSGIYAIYKECNVKVLPVALNTGLFWERNSFTKKPGTYVIKFLPSINPGLEKEEFNHKLEVCIENACKEIGDSK